MNNYITINLILLRKGCINAFRAPDDLHQYTKIIKVYNLKNVTFTDNEKNVFDNVFIREDYIINAKTIEELLGYYDHYNKNYLHDNYKVGRHRFIIYFGYKGKKTEIITEYFKKNIDIEPIIEFYKNKIEMFNRCTNNKYEFSYDHMYVPSFRYIFKNYENFQYNKIVLKEYLYYNWFLSSEITDIIDKTNDKTLFIRYVDSLVTFFNTIYNLSYKVKEIKNYYRNLEETKNVGEENLASMDKTIYKIDENLLILLFD